MNPLKKMKNLSGDLVYSVSALAIMSGTLQIIVYPYLTRQMGADEFGNVLALISVISIMGSTFGTGANFSRILICRQGGCPKGDYNRFLLWISLCFLPLSFFLVHEFDPVHFEPVYCLGFWLLTTVSMLRYYGDVDYRIHLQFRKYFIYYMCITAGYVIGVLTYPLFHSWIMIVLLGETMCIIYVLADGTLFDRPRLARSERARRNFRSFMVLSLSNLIASLILNADRLLIAEFVGSQEVTIFFAATLIGKVIATLTLPLEGVLMGYCSRYKGKFSKKLLLTLSGICLLLGIVATLLSTIASHIIIPFMYPDVYQAARPFFLVANAGQVFYFISGTMMVIILNFTKEQSQLIINTVYAFSFILLVLPAVIIYGLWGIAIALLAVNLLRFLFIFLIGFHYARNTSSKNKTLPVRK